MCLHDLKGCLLRYETVEQLFRHYKNKHLGLLKDELPPRYKMMGFDTKIIEDLLFVEERDVAKRVAKAEGHFEKALAKLALTNRWGHQAGKHNICYQGTALYAESK